MKFYNDKQLVNHKKVMVVAYGKTFHSKFVNDEKDLFILDALEFDGKTYPIHPLPDNLMDIINAGGLVKAMQKRNGII